MIIWVIFILLILMVLAWTLIPNKGLKIIAGVALAIAMTGATTLLTLTLKDHYGMRQVTTIKQKKVYSAGGDKSPAGVLITTKIGPKDKKHMVLVYQDTKKGKAKAHFIPKQKHITESIKRESYYKKANVKKAKLVTKTTRWRWKSGPYKFWFNLGQDNELVKETNSLMVPKDTWLVLSAKQAKKLKTLMADMNKSTDSTQLAAMAAMSREDQAKLIVKMVELQLKK